MENQMLPYLEWETLYKPLTISKIEETQLLPEGPKEIIIERDDHYCIQAILKMSGKGWLDFFRLGEERPLGSWIEPIDITGHDSSTSTTIILKSCSIGGTSEISKPLGPTMLTASLNVQGITINHPIKKEEAYLTEWYLNGPKGDFIFSHGTVRKLSSTYNRERLLGKDKTLHQMEVSGGANEL